MCIRDRIVRGDGSGRCSVLQSWNSVEGNSSEEALNISSCDGDLFRRGDGSDGCSFCEVRTMEKKYAEEIHINGALNI